MKSGLFNRGHRIYAAINDSTLQADSVPFIVFRLSMLRDAILSMPPQVTPQVTPQVAELLRHVGRTAVRRCKLR
ncbi:MAG TPA: hypothetical protein VJA19_15910, partial [Pseudomonas sp.]|nr:hypothetical protein [Pseudomonas sp.]